MVGLRLYWFPMIGHSIGSNWFTAFEYPIRAREQSGFHYMLSSVMQEARGFRRKSEGWEKENTPRVGPLPGKL